MGCFRYKLRFTLFAEGFSITYKTLIVSLYFAFFQQLELLHTPVPEYIDFLGCKYQGGINIKRYRKYRINIANINHLAKVNQLRLPNRSRTYSLVT